MQPLEKIEAIAVSQKQIEQNEIRMLLLDRGLRLRDRLGLAAAFQLFLLADPIDQIFPEHRVVFDHEHTPLVAWSGNG